MVDVDVAQVRRRQGRCGGGVVWTLLKLNRQKIQSDRDQCLIRLIPTSTRRSASSTGDVRR